MLMQKVLTDNRAQRSERTPSVVWMSEMENNLARKPDSFSFSPSTLPCFLCAVTVSCPSKISPLAPHSRFCLWTEFDTGNTGSWIWKGAFGWVHACLRLCQLMLVLLCMSPSKWKHRKMTDVRDGARACGPGWLMTPPSGSRQPRYSSRSHATLCYCSPMDLCPWHREAISLFICALSLLHTYSSSRHLPAGHWGGGKLHCQSIFSTDLMKAV